MQYIKHYYVDENSNAFCCEFPEPSYKRHPYKEYSGLSVRIWLTDSEGVDVCLSELPDSTPVSTITSSCGKNAVQVLTETEFSSVAIPYFESQTLSMEAQEARKNGDETISSEKESASSTKLNEAIVALHSL
jgi:hypothetical protein